jgi:cytochrome P450 family 4
MIYPAGELWRERRSLLNPAFHFQILNGFVETFNDLSLDCAAKMEESLGRTGQKEMNVFSIMSKLVLDILCGRIY